MEIFLFNRYASNAFFSFERASWGYWYQSSLIFLHVLLENGAKNLVVKVFTLNTFKNVFKVEGKFKLLFNYFYQSSFIDWAWLVCSSSKGYKSINYILYVLLYSLDFCTSLPVLSSFYFFNVAALLRSVVKSKILIYLIAISLLRRSFLASETGMPKSV